MSGGLRNRDIEELLAALDDGNISEDGEDIGDENDIDYYPNIEDLLQELDDENVVGERIEDPPLVMEEEQVQNMSPVASVSGPSSVSLVPSGSRQQIADIVGMAAWRSRSRDLIWRKRSFVYNEDRVAFLGNSELTPEIAKLVTPFQFFVGNL